MEISSIDSEMIESLNILRPPVKRKNEEISYFNYQPNNVLFVSDYRKKQRRRSKFNNTRRLVESSTSLILQKTSDAQIYEKLSIVSNTDIGRNGNDPLYNQENQRAKKKPVIQVIVIPKRSRIPRGAAHKERKVVTKIIHNSHSDLDDSIQTKQVYIVVSGKKKGKVYEIKTTESASKEYDIDDVSNEVINEIDFCYPEKENAFDESIMASVNYGTNYDRSMKSEEDKENEQHVMYASADKVNEHVVYTSHDCKCCACSANKKKPAEQKNKIKIFGQLGLTEDDRYVLKCGATLNNQPIMTDFQRIGEKISCRDYDKLNSVNYQTTKPLIAKLTSLGNSCKGYEPPSLSLSLGRPKKQEPSENRYYRECYHIAKEQDNEKGEDNIGLHHYTFYETHELEKDKLNEKRNSTSDEVVVEVSPSTNKYMPQNDEHNINKRSSRSNSPKMPHSDTSETTREQNVYQQSFTLSESISKAPGSSKEMNRDSLKMPKVTSLPFKDRYKQPDTMKRKEISENKMSSKHSTGSYQPKDKTQVPNSDMKHPSRSPRVSDDFSPKEKVDLKLPYQEQYKSNRFSHNSMKGQNQRKDSLQKSPRTDSNQRSKHDKYGANQPTENKHMYKLSEQREYEEMQMQYPGNYTNYRQPTAMPYPGYMNSRPPPVPGPQEPRMHQEYQGQYPNYYNMPRSPAPINIEQRRYMEMPQPYPNSYMNSRLPHQASQDPYPDFQGYYPNNQFKSRPPPGQYHRPYEYPMSYPNYQSNYRPTQMPLDRGYPEYQVPYNMENMMTANKDLKTYQDGVKKESKDAETKPKDASATKVAKKAQSPKRKPITKTKETQNTPPRLSSFRGHSLGVKGAEELYEQVFGINDFYKSEGVQVKPAKKQHDYINPLENIVVCGCSESPPKLKSDDQLNMNKEEDIAICPSPMVVISVFSKHENINESCNLKCHPLITDSISRMSLNNDDVPEKKVEEESSKPTVAKKSKPRSRSPSPSPRKRTLDNKNVAEPSMLRKSRSKSPKQSIVFSKAKNDPKKKPSQKSFGETVKFKSKDSKQKKKKKSKSHDIGVNTDIEVKKQIIVSDDKMDSELMKIKINRSLKRDVSAISVNIDSENEFYDVSFHQGKFVTDLSVRKTMKDSLIQSDSNKKSDSLENFFPLEQDYQQQTAVERYKNVEYIPTEDTNSLIRDITGIRARDSLEITHRTDDVKNEMPTQTENLKRTSVSNDDLDFFAPIKHYTGDDCQICDPMERDREIRKLLGIDRRVRVGSSSDEQMLEEDEVQNFLHTPRCDNKIVADVSMINQDDSYTSCYFSDNSYSKSKKKNKKPKKHKSNNQCIVVESMTSCDCSGGQKQKKSPNYGVDVHCCEPPKPRPRCILVPKCQETTPRHDYSNCYEPRHLELCYREPPPPKPPCKPQVTVTTRCSKEEPEERTTICQQLILNRNIQVFLQVEQFCKQKPICLSRKQYDRVKKTIQKTLSKSKKAKPEKREYHDVQSCCSISKSGSKSKTSKHSSCCKIANCVRKSIMKITSKFCDDQQCNAVLIYTQDVGTSNAEKKKTNFDRRSLSSLQVTYANLSNLRDFTSVSAIGSSAASSLNQRQTDSIETLFREHKKMHTPNLGTSDISNASECQNSSVKITQSKDRPKRPFLKRLMSCLVMRSEKTPVAPYLAPIQKDQAGSITSSLDSYHLSTSLGGIEMSSSLYDTSVSFYTNHSVRPEFYKIKRGFFSSVREFLNSRK